MNSRGIALVARRAGGVLLIVALSLSLVTLCWGSLPRTSRATSPVLGPSARAATLLTSRSRSTTPGLVDLTNSPADERNPAWSPGGGTLAFTSNGLDLNGDGRIDTVVPQRSLFTVARDGSGLLRFPLASGSVVALAWRYDGTKIYTVVLDNGVYTIRAANVATQQFSTIYPVNPGPALGAIANIACAPNGTTLYFDMQGLDGFSNIYSVSADGQGALTQVTAGPGNNRHPVFANLGAEIVFESDRTGNWAIYGMRPDGTMLRTLTFPLNADDTSACATADGRLVFTSSRLTAPSDLNYNTNVWVMPYGPETAGAATPRFFTDGLSTSDQLDPAPQVLAGRADEVLFASNRNRADFDIYLGSFTDDEAPYLTAAPTVTPKIANPGDPVTVSVAVTDLGSGVRHVWLQVKDPDPAAVDSQSINHVITRSATDKTSTGVDVATTAPIEFGPYDPSMDAYLDISQPTSHPGYYARAGSAAIFDPIDTSVGVTEGTGYPQVPTHWIEMSDDATNGDAVAGDGVFTCRWLTPMIASDWYFDVIVEDQMDSATDSFGEWHGNRRRFDNVAGCTTVTQFLGGHHVLLVDDYLDGQRFLSQGVPPVAADYTAASFLNSPYYFTGGTSTLGTKYPSAFTSDSEYGGADVWRIMARGPVPDAVYNAYLPTQVIQVNPLLPQSTTQVTHGEKLIVWASPSSWYRIMGANSGTLTDPTVQARLRQFIAAGGRVIGMGKDLPTGLTAAGTQPANNLLNTDFGALFVAETSPFTAIWTTWTLAVKRMTDASLIPNGNLSLYPNVDPITGSKTITALDTMDFSPTRRTAPSAGSVATLGAQVWGQGASMRAGAPLIGITNDPASGGRTMLYTIGYEHISVAQRGLFMRDAFEWMMEGSLAGSVVQVNGQGPIANALVVVKKTTGVPPAAVTTPVAATRTDATGSYLVRGIRPGDGYVIEVTANGYYGTTEKNTTVRGGYTMNNTTTSFVLNRDTATCTLWGVVTKDAAPVAGASVSITPLGGGSVSSTTTDSTGSYQVANLASGLYQVTATHPTTGQTVTATPNPQLSAGEVKRVDLQFSSSGPQIGKLSGIVTGSGVRIPGASISIVLGAQTVTSTSTDQNGSFSVSGLDAGTYTLTITAPGFRTETRTVSFDPLVGLTLAVDLTPISTDPTLAQVYGRVYDGSTGNPFGGAQVDVYVGEQLIASNTSTSTFRSGTTQYNILFSLSAGVYRLRVSADGRRTQEQILALSPGDIVTTLEFHMGPLLTLGSGMYMFSLPVDFPTLNREPAAIFQVSPDALVHRLATYVPNQAVPGYQFYAGTGSLPIQPGEAYWAKLTSPMTVQVSGTNVDETVPFARTLHAGWNMVGNPFPFTVSLGDCTVTPAGGVAISWSEAQRQNLVGGAIYTWDDWSQGYVITPTLQPYLGYWILAKADCTLNIANIARSSRAISLSTTTRRRGLTNDWRVRLQARAGSRGDGASYFGVAPGATDGFGNTDDYRRPPTPLGDYVTVSFPRRTWGADSGDYLTDIQAAAASDKRWTVRVETNQANTDVVVSWPELVTQLPAGYQAVLRDAQTGQHCYMNTLGQYVFRSGPQGGSREFEITVSPRSEPLRVTGVSSTRTAVRGETTITFALSQPAQVSIAIRTQSGRLIRMLTPDTPAMAGSNSVVWDQLGTDGRALPRGVYVCEVRAMDALGRSARGTGLVAVLAVR